MTRSRVNKGGWTYLNSVRSRAVRVRVDPPDSLLLPRLPTPGQPIGEEEDLLLREVIKTRKNKILLLIISAAPRLEGSSETASIGDVLTEGELPVDGQIAILRRDGIVVILLHEAVCLVLEGLDSGLIPPVAIVTILVIVPAGRIKGVRQLVSCNCAEGSIGQVLGKGGIVEDGSLHDTSRENDLVAGWVVVRVHRRRGHSPLSLVHRLAGLRPLTPHIVSGGREPVGKERVGGYVDAAVVLLKFFRVGDIRALGGISNLLSDEMHFVNSKLAHLLSHPFRMVELDDEGILDVVDDLVTQVLRLFGKSAFDKEAAENPG